MIAAGLEGAVDNDAVGGPTVQSGGRHAGVSVGTEQVCRQVVDVKNQ